MRRTKRQPGLRDALAAGVADRERDAEVGDNRLLRLQQNVFGLEVALHDAARLREIEGTGDRRDESHRVIHRQLLLALQSRPQRYPLDERHHVIQ